MSQLEPFHCSVIDERDLPGEKERRIAAALLFTSEEAHRAYHLDVQFRVLINSLAANMALVVDDMATAAQVRLEGKDEAVKALERKTWPMLFTPGEES